ncbi:photosystem II oxygen-evolving enhancer protein [Zostera marina]|uniref:Photosystem II oxygen-evolving enhancer protein n=1 Tax=Zostera marina TaxID=29655 RepID=A0A0K9P3R7_ZOSMR|nr:photosystem II oxygen-evolving enhancer protein [Zostera marina]
MAGIWISSASQNPVFLRSSHISRHRFRTFAALPPQNHKISDIIGTINSYSKSRRRSAFFHLLLVPLSGIHSQLAKSIEYENKDDELEVYTDGFTVLHPSSWLKVDKAGATVLFVDEKAKGNTIGVVVNPVKLFSLKDFGTSQFVAERLIQAEKRKESTKDAQLLKFGERLGNEGLSIYEFEYTLDSSRGGMKRIFSAAFVVSKKLYLLNISHSDTPENPLNGKTRMILERILHSFDVKL